MGKPNPDLLTIQEATLKFGLALSCVLLASPAFAQSVAEKTGLNSVIGVAPTTADFAKEAGSSDLFEIQSSQLAQERSDAPTKAFATQMITDHQKTTADMKGMFQSGKLQGSPPTGMVPSDQTMFASLQKANGSDFTKQYHDDQVTVHKNAVSLFERYHNGGANPDLKTWTGATLPVLQHHLQMAQDLDK